MKTKTSPKEHYYVSQTNDSVEGPWAIFIYRAVKHETGIYYISFSLPLHKDANDNYGHDLSFSERQDYSGNFRDFEKSHMVRFAKRISKSEYVKLWNRAKMRMLYQIKKQTALGSVESLNFTR